MTKKDLLRVPFFEFIERRPRISFDYAQDKCSMNHISNAKSDYNVYSPRYQSMGVGPCRHVASNSLHQQRMHVWGDCLYTEARVGAALVGDSGDNLRIDVRARVESPNGILHDYSGANLLHRRHKSSNDLLTSLKMRSKYYVFIII